MAQQLVRGMEEVIFYNDELRYARGVELSNARAAMLGFLGVLLVEAATGRGIIGQGFMYAKMSGLLGEKSGF